jgi:hypothetical protein
LADQPIVLRDTAVQVLLPLAAHDPASDGMREANSVMMHSPQDVWHCGAEKNTD